MITLDPEYWLVYVHGNPVEFSPKEYSLLEYLYQAKGSPRPIERILGALWSEDLNPVTGSAVYNLVHKIRKKLPIGCIGNRGRVGYFFRQVDRPFWLDGC